MSVIAAVIVDKVNEYRSITTSAEQMLQGMIERLPYLLIALLVFVLFWLFSGLFKTLVSKFAQRRHAKTHLNLIKVIKRVGSALILFLGLMVALVIAMPGFTPAKLIGALGIGSVAIGFAFKDIFQNLLSGLLLLIAEPFRIGDQIISGDYEGTVEDIKIRATVIKTYDGREVIIPNSQLYTTPMTVNTAYKRRRLQVDVGIGYNDDIRVAKQQILQALQQIDSVSTEAAPSVIATSFADSSINLTVRWFIEDGTQANKVASIHEVIVGIKDALDQAGVGIPFPIRTLDFSDPSVQKAINTFKNDAATASIKTE